MFGIIIETKRKRRRKEKERGSCTEVLLVLLSMVFYAQPLLNIQRSVYSKRLYLEKKLLLLLYYNFIILFLCKLYNCNKCFFFQKRGAILLYEHISIMQFLNSQLREIFGLAQG